MKQIILLLLFISAITRSFAQSPQAFPYQAVARDINGNLLANKNISLRFSVLDSSNNGASIYQETHNTTTNLLGLFNLYIGQGIVTSGTFANINWALGAKFIKVELDTSGGNSYTLMGVSQLMSVPYALHAGSNLHSTGPVIDPGHPTTNSWTQKANAGNISRSMGVGFSIGQSGYIGTGSSGGGLIGLDDLWEYNVSSNTWTQKATFPGGGRKGAVGFSIGNKGYIGCGESGLPPVTYVNYDLWEYDPALNAWTQKTNLPASARKFATGFSIGTKGYIGLGTDGASDLIDFWEYNPTTDSWLQKANYSGNGKRFVASFSVSNKGYIGLGTDVNGNFYNDWNEYDPVTNAWTAKTTFPSSGRHSTAGFTMNNKGYVGTGTDGNSYLNEFWEYNSATDTWSPRAPFSGMARINAVGFSIGNKGYIGTGDNFEMWEYMDDNVSGTAYSSAANIGSNNLVTDGAWTLYNNHIYNANSGNVGIGTSTPTNKFSVIGNVDFSGNVGIGVSSPASALDVSGKIKINDDTLPPSTGMIRWNATENDFEGYDGVKWRSFTKSSGTWGNLPVNATENQKAYSADIAGGDNLGSSVSMSGDYAIVGAIGDMIGANSAQGSAYIFKRNGATWIQEAKLVASDGAAYDNFGYCVSISGDYAVVGVPNKDAGQGAVYVYKRTGTIWNQQAKISAIDGASGDNFGKSVCISGDDIIIGSPDHDPNFTSNSGAAYVFRRNLNTWSQQAKLGLTNIQQFDFFGHSVGISGDFAIISALRSYLDPPTTYIFKRTGTTWSQTAALVVPTSPTILPAGNTVLVSGDYALVNNIVYNIDPNIPPQYQVYAFKRNNTGSAWAFESELVPNDISTRNGFGVSLSLSGDVAVVGASGANGGQGAAYIYKHIGSIWKLESTVVASDAHGDAFGYAVSISGNNIIVGAPFDDEGLNTDQGAVYFFNK